MVNPFLIRKISFCRRMRGEALAGCFGFAGFEEELRNVPLIFDNNGVFKDFFLASVLVRMFEFFVGYLSVLSDVYAVEILTETINGLDTSYRI